MNKSDTIGALAAALAKAQGEMAPAKKDTYNKFFNSHYANFASIVEAIKKPLSENGLAYVQTTEIDDAGVVVETTLMHDSGEWISGRLRMKPAKDDPQGVGSCLTYARKYGLQAIVGIDADDDDDGNAASGNSAPKATTPAPAQPKPPTPIRPEPAKAEVAADDDRTRTELVRKIAADAQIAMISADSLNKAAKKEASVDTYDNAPLDWLITLAERVAAKRKEKEGGTTGQQA